MQRWIIKISDYAITDYPEKWGEWRNPVKYTTLEELGLVGAGMGKNLSFDSSMLIGELSY